MPQIGIADMKNSFFNNNKAVLTVMVQAKTPNRIKELIDKSLPEGAEAFGIQLEQLESIYQNKEVYKDIFSYAENMPLYITNYRGGNNQGKSDVRLSEELLEAAECGGELFDVMGDYFDPQPGEITYNEDAIEKQKELIKKLHSKGVKVLMSSHVLKFISADEVLKIALAQQARGADICKIVTGAETMEQQIENLKIVNMLKEKLDIPFLFLSGGECKLLRRIGGEIGCCMYLCVYEYDEMATVQQPLLKNMRLIRDNIL